MTRHRKTKFPTYTSPNEKLEIISTSGVFLNCIIIEKSIISVQNNFGFQFSLILYGQNKDV